MLQTKLQTMLLHKRFSSLPDPVFCLLGFGPFGEHMVNASWVAVQVCGFIVYLLNVYSSVADISLKDVFIGVMVTPKCH